MSGIYRFPILPLPWIPSAPRKDFQMYGRSRLFRRIYLVLRTSDVREVLANDSGRSAAFSVADYGDHMRETVGDFFLGLDQTAGNSYDVEKELALGAFLGGTIHGSDAFEALRADLTEIVRQETAAAVQSLETVSRREIDVVSDLANKVPVRLVERYFGIPDRDGSLLQDCQEISFYIFNFFSELPGIRALFRVRRRARKAGARLRENVGREVMERWKILRGPSGPPRPQHVLDRLLLSDPTPKDEKEHLDRVRRTLTGLISGALVATVGQFVSAVDRLMDLPADDRRALQYAALAAAHRGNPRPLWNQLREASRFGAVPPFLFRRCRRPFKIARGSAREKTVFPGDLVVVSPMFAGRDPFTFQDPLAFNPLRPDSSYLLFGYGLHACIGAFFGEILMVQMAAQLFMLRGLERNRERGRSVSYRGAPQSFVLNFLPAQPPLGV